MNIERARYNMIEQQIRPWDVLDPAVLTLLAAVKREDFLPVAYRSMAFTDTQLPLPGGRFTLEPRVEARLLQELQVQRHETVLEIGTGSGFIAALLGHRAQQVITLESDPDLARSAAQHLAQAGVTNVRVQTLPASACAQGLAAEGPFDAILLSGSVHEVPRALLEQLKPGGRLLAVVGDQPMMRARMHRRNADQTWTQTDLFDTVIPRLAGFDTGSRFSF